MSQKNFQLKEKLRKLEVKMEHIEQYSRVNCWNFGNFRGKGWGCFWDSEKSGCFNGQECREHETYYHLRPWDSKWPAGIKVRPLKREVKLKMMSNRKVKRNLRYQQLAVPAYMNESLSSEWRKFYSVAWKTKWENSCTYL